MCEIEINGLRLHKIKSLKPTPVNNMDDIQTCIKTDSLVVAYLDYKVLIGRYKNNEFIFHDNHDIKKNIEYLQKIRVFNKDEELLLWRSNNGFKGRYRKDEDGAEITVVDAEQVLFGTKREESKDGFTKISEKRGVEIILPFIEFNLDDKKNRIKLKTRNYVDYNEAGQATYIDCRFMGFTNNGSNLK